MTPFKPNWQSAAATLCLLAALVRLPLTGAASGAVTAAILILIVAALGLAARARSNHSTQAALGFAVHLAALLLIGTVTGAEGTAGWSFFSALAACWLLAWRLVTLLSGDGSRRSGTGFGGRVLVPVLFGVWILILWEAITRGAGVPFVLLPPPSAIGVKILASIPTLVADFRQTVLKAMIFGYVVGSGAGFLTAVLADRYRFLSNGLLPIGNLVSALPIIGIAPVMVIWFGFDWQSKAAVVIVMTFFPILVNTLEGLKASGHMERDLMRTYGASHWQTLMKLRLPAAMPFIFNALKINSTLALIGALVSEFFGTPIVGMGFRISTEVGRMNLDMVWAEIALAAVAGSLFYGALALLERAVTFWHPSYR
nr:ABC transporter permease [uncultured Gellertiella sp.]